MNLEHGYRTLAIERGKRAGSLFFDLWPARRKPRASVLSKRRGRLLFAYGSPFTLVACPVAIGPMTSCTLHFASSGVRVATVSFFQQYKGSTSTSPIAPDVILPCPPRPRVERSAIYKAVRGTGERSTSGARSSGKERSARESSHRLASSSNHFTFLSLACCIGARPSLHTHAHTHTRHVRTRILHLSTLGTHQPCTHTRTHTHTRPVRREDGLALGRSAL